MKSTLFLGVALSALALGVSGSQAANLIANGSFETGSFSDWTLSANTNSTAVLKSINGFIPEDGNYLAALGNSGFDATLSQTFSDVAGVVYTFAFYLGSDGAAPNDFGVTGPGSLSLSLLDVPASPFTEYDANFTGNGTDTVTFTFRDDPGYLVLDNVSVTPVPEPATWGLMLAGMGVVGVSLRRRRIAATA